MYSTRSLCTTAMGCVWDKERTIEVSTRMHFWELCPTNLCILGDSGCEYIYSVVICLWLHHENRFHQRKFRGNEVMYNTCTESCATVDSHKTAYSWRFQSSVWGHWAFGLMFNIIDLLRMYLPPTLHICHGYQSGSHSSNVGHANNDKSASLNTTPILWNLNIR